MLVYVILPMPFKAFIYLDRISEILLRLILVNVLCLTYLSKNFNIFLKLYYFVENLNSMLKFEIWQRKRNVINMHNKTWRKYEKSQVSHRLVLNNFGGKFK